MKKITRTLILPFIIGSTALLTACGGGGGDSSTTETTNISSGGTLNAHYFVGTTVSSGTEVWRSDGTDQGTTMVKEINDTKHSNPSNFVQIGSTVYFTANNGVDGIELWKRQAGSVTMVKNINPTGSSNPYSLTSHNGKLYFLATDNVSANSLWESDGTDAGTTKISTLASVSSITSITNGDLFFVTGTSTTTKLNTYNGTTVTTLVPTPAVPTYISMVTAVGTNIYFSGYNSASGYELWKSDGTNAGTVLAKDFVAGTGSGLQTSRYANIYSVNGKVVVIDSNNYPYNKVWIENATATDIVPLMVTLPGAIDPIQANTYFGTSYASQEGNDGDVYFAFQANSYRTWRTDGTEVGTNLILTSSFTRLSVLKATNGTKFAYLQNSLQVINATNDGLVNLNTGTTSRWTVAGNLAYYVTSANELMVTDGTNAGVKISDLTSLPLMFGGTTELYMSYNSDVLSGSEPWVSDGTSTGTVMLADINPNPTGNSDPSDKVIFNNTLYFIANDGANGKTVWKSDGSDAGTTRVTTTQFSDVSDLTVSGDYLYFVADDSTYGREVWVSDGTEAGTHVLIDLNPGRSDSNPYSLVDANGSLFFIDRDYNVVWKSNGTLETTTIASLVTPSTDLTAAGNKVYYVASINGDDELWVSDGTLAGSHVVKDINPSGDAIYYRYHKAAALGNILYFQATDGANGRELWKTDGTEAGTSMVIDIDGSSDGLDRYNTLLFAAGTNMYFTDNNNNLWKTDGTEVNTVQLTDTTVDSISLASNGFAVMNNKVYFSASNGTDGYELWESDGTVIGTVMTKNINTSTGSNPYGFNVYNNTLFFYADNGAYGYELWKSDGTNVGTVLVKDIFVGIVSGAEPFSGANNNAE